MADSAFMDSGPWAIEAVTFGRLLAAAERADVRAIGLRVERPKRPPFQNVAGTAIINISGLLEPAPTFFGQLFGAETTHDDLRGALDAALAETGVKRILLVIDSPGGSAAGLQRLAGDVRRADARKPVYAYTEAMMGSAAYFVGSQSRRIFVSSEAWVGSVGTILIVRDWSKAFEREGVKTYAIASGSLKATAALGTELDKPKRDYLQQLVDDTAAVFVQAVVDRRPVTTKQVMNLEGAMLVGKRAVRAGLADRVATLDNVLEMIRGA